MAGLECEAPPGYLRPKGIRNWIQWHPLPNCAIMQYMLLRIVFLLTLVAHRANTSIEPYLPLVSARPDIYVLPDQVGGRWIGHADPDGSSPVSCARIYLSSAPPVAFRHAMISVPQANTVRVGRKDYVALEEEE
jgi:hypothetical protein